MKVDQLGDEINLNEVRKLIGGGANTQIGREMSALVTVDDALDDLLHVGRLLNAASLACFAMKGDDSDAVAEVIEVARGSLKVALGRLDMAIEEIQQAERAAA